MKITETQKLIIAIIIFIISGFIIYNTFFSSSNSGTVSVDATALATSTQGQDILDLADKLDSMSINSDLFKSPVFVSLIDFDTPINPEPQGRPNPFAQIGNDAGSVTIQNFVSTTTSKVLPVTKKK